MGYTVEQAAALVGGILRGDGSGVITDALPLAEAGPQSITFIAPGRHRSKLEGCKAAAVIVPLDFQPIDIPSIAVKDPFEAMLKIASTLAPPAKTLPMGIDPRASVHPTAELGPDVYVGPFAVIEAGVVVGRKTQIHPHAVLRSGCRIGADCEVHPHAVIYPQTTVGDRCLIHAGVVLGGDGFGYRLVNGAYQKVPQLGACIVGNDVQVGANSTIDRATLGHTIISDGTKIDSQVMIGHNCRIGKHNILVSQVGVAGSCTTGEYVVMAGKAGIADHVHIGDRAVVGANTGVPNDLEGDLRYFGSPARPESLMKRIVYIWDKLPEMRRDLNKMKKALGITDEEKEPRRVAG